MLSELFNLKHFDRKLFKRHFIRNVIIEIRFVSLSKELLFQNIDLLNEKFTELSFNEYKTIKQVEFKMNLEQKEPEQILQSDNDVGIVFFNSEEKKQLELFQDKLVCSVSLYNNFDEFLIQLSKIFEILKSISSSGCEITHIGFRKINTIIATEMSSFEGITKNFNNALFAPLRTEILSFDSFSSYKDVLEVDKNNNKCLINTSCLKRGNSDFEVNLDIDLIDSNMEGNINLIERLQELNSLNYDLFLWSITDDFKKIMNEED